MSFQPRWSTARATGAAVLCTSLAGVSVISVGARQTSQRAAVLADAGDVMTAGERVRIQETVAGDVAAAGASVAIEAPVTGYVMSAGRTVTVDAPVGNDLWAAGETVEVNGEVTNNVRAAGRSVHLGTGAIVGGAASLAGNTVTTEGRIARDLRIGAATARIGGEVAGRVEVSAQRVSVMPDTIIRGDLVVRSPQPPEIAEAAQVLGQVRYEELREEGWFAWPAFWAWSFLGLLVVGVAALAFSTPWAARVATTLRARPGMSLVTGALVLIVTPFVVAGLAVTLIGIPLAVVLVGLYVAVLVLSAVFVSYRVGSWLLDRAGRPGASRWVRMAAGAFVVSLGMSLPLVGWVLALLVLLVGTGALALERRSVRTPLASSGAA
jgi:hypothetical protein